MPSINSSLSSINGLPVIGGYTESPLPKGLMPYTIVNLPGLNRFRKKVLRAQYEVVRINTLHSSSVLGTNVDDVNGTPIDATLAVEGFQGRLSKMLAAQTGIAEAGFIPAMDGRVAHGGGVATNSGFGATMQHVRVANTPVAGCGALLTAGQTLTYSLPVCTTIEIYYFSSKGGASAAGGLTTASGTFSYAVDGGGATTTTVDGVNALSYDKITITGLSAATHTLVLTGVTATSWVVGVGFHSGKGFSLNRFGFGGSDIFDVFGDGPATGYSAGAQHRIGAFFGPAGAAAVTTAGITSGNRQILVSDSSSYFVGQPISSDTNMPIPNQVASIDSPTLVTLRSAPTGTAAAQSIYVGGGLGTLGGDLYIITTGHNDWRLQNSNSGQSLLPNYVAELTRIVNLISSMGGCSLLVGPPYDTSVPPDPEQYSKPEYWAAIEQVANTEPNCTAVMLNNLWGPFDTSVEEGTQTVPGGVHPSRYGYVVLANILFNVITFQTSILS